MTALLGLLVLVVVVGLPVAVVLFLLGVLLVPSSAVQTWSRRSRS